MTQTFFTLIATNKILVNSKQPPLEDGDNYKIWG